MSSTLPWELARASGITSYVLMLALVATGIVLAHPWAARLRRPRPATRIAVHVSLATFTLAFTALHVVVLATDEWAQVGWGGAILPLASTYRPVPVTLGVLAVWAGLVTGVTARLAGHFAGRLWWSIHKVAAAIFLLVWAHSVLAGSDAHGLRLFYLVSGGALAMLAVSRYAVRSPRERVAELAAGLRGAGAHVPPAAVAERGTRISTRPGARS